MITSVPRKPPATSTQRNADTCSFNSVAASSVMTSGVIITMAVNSPDRHVAQAQEGEQAAGEQQQAAQQLPGQAVRAPDLPSRARQHRRGGGHGLEHVANHSAISSGTEALTYLVVVSRAAKQALAATTRAMPASACGLRSARAADAALTGCGRPAVPTRASVPPAGRAAGPGRCGFRPGLWKSLPREAARPEFAGASRRTCTYSAAVWLPVTTSTAGRRAP
jgi:hypothetical protein